MAAASGLITGIITRGVGGFYDVFLDSGECRRCRPRGRLRKEVDRLLVGDRVTVRLLSAGEGIIEELHPRRNALRRPPIANVDQAVVVIPLAEPDPDRMFLDRLLTVVAAAGLDIVLCLNKVDLVSPSRVEALAAPYQKWLPVHVVSAQKKIGIDGLIAVMRGRVSTLAGPSGAGKSALLNAINPEYGRRTGAISVKGNRGRHTTTAVELLPLPGGGWVADTPGFAQLDLTSIPSEALDRYFWDFAAFIGDCRFVGCRHVAEPDCGVRAAVARGLIDPVRYRHYVAFYEEVREAELRQYR